MSRYFLKSRMVWLCSILAILTAAASWGFVHFSEKSDDASYSWMHSQVRRDLAPYFSSGITQQHLDQIMQHKEELCLVRFQIVNNTISCPGQTALHERAQILLAGFEEMLKTHKLPDVDFIISVHDHLVGFPLPPGPVFVFANDPTANSGLILFPDFETFSGNPKFLAEVRRGEKLYPWAQRKNQAFWRGATTGRSPVFGHTFSIDSFQAFPRSALVKLSLDHPELLDARFTFLTQSPHPEELRAQFPHFFGKALTVKRHFQYKYQILIDGNSCAYSRAFWQFFSGCPVFKFESRDVQWYYAAMQPYVHYIPVGAFGEDLIEKLTWAQAHDPLVQEIGANAKEFAVRNLSQAAVFRYVALLLNEYAQLQKR